MVKRKRGSRKFYTCVLPIAVVFFLLIGTTTVNRPMPGLVFYENCTFKFTGAIGTGSRSGTRTLLSLVGDWWSFIELFKE